MTRRWTVWASVSLAAMAAACGSDGADDLGGADAAADADTDAHADVGAPDAAGVDVTDAGSGDLSDAVDDADASDIAGDAVTDVEDGEGSGERWYTAEETLTGAEALAWVDPFIGTGGAVFQYASLTPAAQIPLGFVKVGPDTTTRGFHPPNQHFSGYNAIDTHVRGFSHIRLIGTGAADLGLLRVLPQAEPDAERMPPRAWTALEKRSEFASPGYYRARLPDEGVTAEMSADGWAAIHRYTFDGDAALTFDATASVLDTRNLDANIEVAPDAFRGALTYNGGFATRARPFTVYFDARFEPPADAAYIWHEDGYLPEETEGSGERVGGVFVWDEPDQTVELRIGLSLIDAERAAANREAQTEGVSLEQMRSAAEALWSEKLDNVEIGGGTDALRTVFFTALYNAYRMPSRLDEPDGRYRGVDGEVHTVEGHAYYTDMSLWDSFRTVHPWYELTDPEVARDCVLSLQRMYEQSGRFPRWPAMLGDTGSMLGSPAAMVVSGAALKQIEGPDYEAALEGLIASDYGRLLDETDTRGRDDLEDYVTLGYVPSDRDESVSLTLEYAWADDALARLAELYGHDAAEVLRERSYTFENLFDPERRFFVPRTRDGQFERVPLSSVYMGNGPYTEGSAWHWRFYAFHAPQRLAELFGADGLGEALEEFFASSPLGGRGLVDSTLPDPRYWHGNEPTIHAVYLFAYTDRPERGYHWQREIQTRIYHTGVDGLPGNDDGGTLSSWFLFSALGLYPVAGTSEYVIGSPIFSHATIRSHGVETVIEAPSADLEYRYVDGATVNGTPVESPTVEHADLLGSTVEFSMSREP